MQLFKPPYLSKNENKALTAVVKINDDNLLYEVILADTLDSIKIVALSQMKNQNYIVKVYFENQKFSRIVRQHALSVCTDYAMLMEIAASQKLHINYGTYVYDEIHQHVSAHQSFLFDFAMQDSYSDQYSIAGAWLNDYDMQLAVVDHFLKYYYEYVDSVKRKNYQQRVVFALRSLLNNRNFTFSQKQDALIEPINLMLKMHNENFNNDLAIHLATYIIPKEDLQGYNFQVNKITIRIPDKYGSYLRHTFSIYYNNLLISEYGLTDDHRRSDDNYFQ